MTGGGKGGLSTILGAAAPAALMMIPGVGEAAAPLMEGLGASSGLADILSPALTGAALSGGASALTGGNPLTSALLGGVASGLGAGLTGEGSAAAADGTAESPLASAGTDTANAASQSPLSSIAPNTSDYASPQALQAIESGDASQMPGAITPAQQSSMNAAGDALNAPSAGASSSPLSNIMNWATKNPLKAAMLGNIGLSTVQSFLPRPKVNVGQTADQVRATSPGWNATIPKYNMQNTAAPYAGNWYTYGMQPQAPLYNAMPQPVKRGGMIGYARGGMVRKFASGGMTSPLSAHINPIAVESMHDIGHAIGKHLRNSVGTFSGEGRVGGIGGGHDDLVPAKLSRGEYVHSADVVSALGDGSTEEGARKLKEMDKAVRTHKTSNGPGFPPKAKSPLAYLGRS